MGTGVFGSEYIVASKALNNFDFTVGMGWGRLAGEGDLSNPMTQLSDSFEVRDNTFGMGGELAKDSFFSGDQVGFFGGATYSFETLPLTAMLEYNPDQYEWEQNRGGLKPKSAISAALKWDAAPGVSLTLSRQHGQEWGAKSQQPCISFRVQKSQPDASSAQAWNIARTNYLKVLTQRAGMTPYYLMLNAQASCSLKRQ